MSAQTSGGGPRLPTFSKGPVSLETLWDADPECQPNYYPNEEKTKVREICQIIETSKLKALHFLDRCYYC
jgi:hypothetical protein